MNEHSAMDIDQDIGRIQRIAQVPLLLDVCQRVTGMGLVAIARVTEARWVTCAALDQMGFGLIPGRELDIGTTMCDDIRKTGQFVAIDDVATDPGCVAHVAPREHGFRSYVAVPLRDCDGGFFGTLCAIDPEPRRVDTPEIAGMFRLFAELIALELQTEKLLEQNRRELEREQQTARLREEFIGVVAHDLRNPVAAISSGLRMLEQGRDPARDAMLFGELKKSVLRSDEMIGNLLDSAKGRLDGSLAADMQRDVDLAELVEAIAAEMRIGSGQVIHVKAARPLIYDCDAKRIRQLVSNLVGNAAHHGRDGAPIAVTAEAVAGDFLLTVANAGDPIPPALIPEIFAPFARGGGGRQNGLGLGLYIASQVAEGHGGALSVESDAEETRVMFRMPRRGAPR